MLDEPPVISEEDELPMDAYNVTMRRYQDNLGQGMNYIRMYMDLIMQNMAIDLAARYLTSYMYNPTWDQLWAERRGCVGVVEEETETMSDYPLFLFYFLFWCGLKKIYLFLCLVVQDLT